MIRSLFLAAAMVATAMASNAFAEPPKFNNDTTTLGAILDDAAAKAAFAKVFPELVGNPQLEVVRSSAIGDIAAHIPERMTAEKMKELQLEFDKIK